MQVHQALAEKETAKQSRLLAASRKGMLKQVFMKWRTAMSRSTAARTGGFEQRAAAAMGEHEDCECLLHLKEE